MAKKRKNRSSKATPNRKAVETKSAGLVRAKRKQSTKQERARVMAAVKKEGLTALEVQKRFGVKPVTYYSWRRAQKKTATSRSHQGSPRKRDSLGISADIRSVVRTQIERMLPEIVRSEVARLFDSRRNR